MSSSPTVSIFYNSHWSLSCPVHPSNLCIIEAGSAERTARAIATLEPLEQTDSVEEILASVTLLVRQLAIRPNYTVADGTLALALERSIDVPLERGQRVD